MGARVLGMGLWMPGFPNPATWLGGQPVAGADAPNTAAQAKMRRRNSLLVNMVADVASQASEQAGITLSRLRVVVGSAFGELTTLVEMLEERERDGLLSPLRFQNSVHNSAIGHLSIAHKNKTPAISLAAGNDTVAMALLEAMTLLALGGDEVIVIVGDEPLPQSIWPGRPTSAISAALVLGADTGHSPRPAQAAIDDLRQAPAAAPGERPFEVDSPCAAILPLIAAIAGRRAGRVDVSPAEDPRWSIAVQPSSIGMSGA